MRRCRVWSSHASITCAGLQGQSGPHRGRRSVASGSRRSGPSFGQRIAELAQGLTAEDLVLCLISGGGSALMALPAPGVTLEDKQAINKALLKSGAAIDEMNCVRKHLSAIKGGRLGAMCAPAKVVTLLISDVPGDSPRSLPAGRPCRTAPPARTRWPS